MCCTQSHVSVFGKQSSGCIRIYKGVNVLERIQTVLAFVAVIYQDHKKSGVKVVQHGSPTPG
jgi:hypothetical protein